MAQATAAGDDETAAELHYIAGRMARERADSAAEIEHLSAALRLSQNPQLSSFCTFFRGLAHYRRGAALDAAGDTLAAASHFSAAVDDLEQLLTAEGSAVHTEPSAEMRSVAYRTRGVVAVRAGALPDAHRVATADGVITATGKLGEMVRFETPAGDRGWIHGDDLKLAPAASADEDPVQPWISRSPPVVLLTTKAGGTAVTGETLPLQGVARDDQAVKDVFVYVNGTKVYYQNAARQASGELREEVVRRIQALDSPPESR